MRTRRRARQPAAAGRGGSPTPRACLLRDGSLPRPHNQFNGFVDSHSSAESEAGLPDGDGGAGDHTECETVSAGARQSALAQARARAAAMSDVLIESLIALRIMAVIVVALRWMVAGRARRPLRPMSATAGRSPGQLPRGLLQPGDQPPQLPDPGGVQQSVVLRVRRWMPAGRVGKPRRARVSAIAV
jgi:hypothetical protein